MNIPAPKTIRNAYVDSVEVSDGYVGIIYKRDNKTRYAVFDEKATTRAIKTGDTITFQKRFDAQNDVLISNQNQSQPTLF